MRRAGILVVVCVLISACQPTQNTVSVGVQPSVEQAILAQVAGQLIEANTDFRVRMVECTDTYDCAGSLKSEQIDFMVSYSGSGLKFVSTRSAAREGTLDQVRTLFKPLGIEWLDRLGFDGRYLLVMPSDKARNLGLESIADLDKLEDGVKITAPSSYWHRPVDGLPGLLRHYGLRLRGKPLLIEDPVKRLLAVHQGLADVAIVRATDGALQDISYANLEDTLEFYPRYEAAVITRTDVMNSHPEAIAALRLLKDRITREVMQGLNYQVAIEGIPPEIAANRFLREAKLIKKSSPSFQTRKPEMIIAVDEPEQVGGMRTFVVRVVRDVFPDHLIKVTTTENAVEAVVQGKARLAIIGANRFFPETEGQKFEKRDNRIEAAAVLDTAYLHILRRTNAPSLKNVLDGTIGVGLPGTSRARLASLILRAANKQPTIFAETKDLIQQVENAEIDAALIFELSGNADINEALAKGTLSLQGLPQEFEILAPFLPPVRIPGGTYARQTEPVDTVGLQIVLASPSPNIDPGPLGGGPAAALLMQNPPLTVEQARALAQAIGNPEPPDPILPSVWMRSVVDAHEVGEGTFGQNLLDTALNVGILVFLGWIGMLIIQRPTR
jgi:glycine betaine/choline ABC-type transport system substrate-binding protein